MIVKNHYQPNRPSFNENLELLDHLLESEIFLKGLSEKANEIDSVLSNSFPVIDNIAWAVEMLDFDVGMDKQCPLTYQYYPGEYGTVFVQFRRSVESHKEEKRICDKFYAIENNEEIYYSIPRSVEARFQQLGISKFLLQRYDDPTLGKDAIIFNTSERLIIQIKDDFDLMINACYFDVFETNTYCQRVYQAYQTGGMPCGWLGQLTLEKGACPEQSIALLHFGKKRSGSGL